MTRTREENARDLQLEELVEEAQDDLADSDQFECTECNCVLDIDESIKADEGLICELCDEQSKANGSAGGDPAETSEEDKSAFFGCNFTVESFGYLNDDREDSPITVEQIKEGLTKAVDEFTNNHYRVKEQFFEFALDLCEACIWDVADGAAADEAVVEPERHESLTA